MGPYYVTALVSLLGPIRRITASTRATFPQRTITSEPLNGTVVDVEVSTHVAGVLDFAGGAVCTMIMSFDIWRHHMPCIEIYGTEGTLVVPDPNGFGGAVKVWRVGDDEWRDVPLEGPYAEGSRGVGVLDMAYGLRTGRPHRANGELTYHVLDAFHAFDEASESGRHVELQSTCERPAPVPVDLVDGELDE
jgi:predicted dehydrogenase